MGETIGEPIVAQQVHGLDVVASAPADYRAQTLLVEAEAVAVCQRKGCWMKIQDGRSSAMVRWEAGCGGKYAFPTDLVGKRIVIQGSFYPKAISEEDALHLEEEAGGKLDIVRDGYEINASAVLIPAQS